MSTELDQYAALCEQIDRAIAAGMPLDDAYRAAALLVASDENA